MAESFEHTDFESVDALIRYFQEKSDDIDKVNLIVVKDMKIESPTGGKRLVSDSCCMIQMCDGTSTMLRREDLQVLLNEGILARMKIPIELCPE